MKLFQQANIVPEEYKLSEASTFTHSIGYSADLSFVSDSILKQGNVLERALWMLCLILETQAIIENT